MKLITEEEVLPIAKEMGYSFTMDDFNSYGKEIQQMNMNCELSDTEMQAVAGGSSRSGFCILIGFAHTSWECSLSSSNGSYDDWMTGFCVGPGTTI